MARRGGMENRPCPACWKGRLESTGVRRKRRPHGFVYHCGFCGRLMTEDSFRHMAGHAAGRRVKGSHHASMVGGSVRDARTGRPLGMVHLGVEGRAAEAFTDSRGRYAVSPVPSHRAFRLEFLRPGYERGLASFAYGVRHGEKAGLDVRLRPSSGAKSPARYPSGLKKTAAGCMAEGIVTDSRGRPVPGALVTLFRQKEAVMARADNRGRYALGPLPAGSYPARVSAHGHAFLRRPVRLAGGRTVCDFRLAAMAR